MSYFFYGFLLIIVWDSHLNDSILFLINDHLKIQTHTSSISSKYIWALRWSLIFTKYIVLKSFIYLCLTFTNIFFINEHLDRQFCLWSMCSCLIFWWRVETFQHADLFAINPKQRCKLETVSCMPKRNSFSMVKIVSLRQTSFYHERNSKT